MSDIDFQNGLVVGMTLAGKNGLVGEAGEIDNSPHIISAENIDFYTTEIVFDRALKSFIVAENLGAFMIMAETYWVISLFIVSDMETINTTTIRLTHASISNVDGVVLIGYNQDSGSIEGSNSVLLKSFIYSYNADFGSAIRIRKRRFLSLDASGISDVGVSFLYSAEVAEPEPNELFLDEIGYLDVNEDELVSSEYNISIL